MKSHTTFTANIEVELFYPDSDDQPDILYQYASDLPKLLEICSEPYLAGIKEIYQAEKVEIGKIELVSLTDEGEYSVQDGKQVIEIGRLAITETKSMKE